MNGDNQAAIDLFGKPYFHNIASFKRINPDISNAITKVKRGNNQLLKVVIKDEMCSLTVSSAEFKPEVLPRPGSLIFRK